MNIRDLLRTAASGSDITETNMFDAEYTEQVITLPDGTVLGGGGTVRITYIKGTGGQGYFSTVSTRYTQPDQPYIPKYVDSNDNTAEVITSKSFGGGFNIEDRPLIGDDGTGAPPFTNTTSTSSSSGSTSSSGGSSSTGGSSSY